ncbi:MAG: signal peptidase I [Candidatus Omnitrophica bacterium 4484_171]|nr:MAG: signal peptidase I [Candidatus Omnitrophica bacterium 4484_171]
MVKEGREIKGKHIRKKSALREWVESAVIAGLLVIFIRTFFFQVYKIPTGSMIPTLKPGDRIFVSKLVYGPLIPFTKARLPGIRKPRRGEVIVFVPPQEVNNFFFKRKVYIKRLIGLGGDRIEIENGNVKVNGKIVVDPVIAKNGYINVGPYGQGVITVPAGKYFFLGDNSKNSLDSRFWGFADDEHIVGKAIFIWWPPNRIGMIE